MMNDMNQPIFRKLDLNSLEHFDSTIGLDDSTISETVQIVNAVENGGDQSLLEFVRKFENDAIKNVEILSRDALEESLKEIDSETRTILENTCERISTFAKAQLDSIQEVTVDVPGGRAGHTVEPIEAVGCYAPGGRYPLPSSVLMTAAVARAAGCPKVYVASPNPNAVTRAAAWIAGADALVPYGGAHMISAMANGTESIPKVDLIVGPGNRWVTAAKQIVFGRVAIDMLAGPSELLILADENADPKVIAADLLAQAEHDDEARTFLVSTSQEIADATIVELEKQLKEIGTREVARKSLQNGGYVLTNSLEQSIEIANRLAAEHLQIQCEDAASIAKRIAHAGCIFVGNRTAEVFGDYGIGPNHTLPTAGTARYRGGLSVFDFVRIRTWLELDQLPDRCRQEMAALADLEGLEAHARACRIART